MKKCESHAEIYHSEPTVFVFDRDVPSIINQIIDPQKGYKNWGNNVFSIALPIPSHRQGGDNICIELMYTDQELSLTNARGRRIFFTSEFSAVSGKLKSNPLISVGNKHNLNRKSKLIDQEVYDEKDENIALSKADFADHVYNGVPPFNTISFKVFTSFFDLVRGIILEAQEKIDLFLDGMEFFFTKMINQPLSSESLKDLFGELTKTMKLTSLIFIAATIRNYEEAIIEELDNTKNKVISIKQIMSERFREPSLHTT